MPNDQVTNRSENTPVTSDLDTFLQEITQLASGGSSTRGRLIFGLDATASREWAWDTACKLQAEMFREAASTGGLDLQLVYYRGIDECKASKWVSDPVRLGKIMSPSCVGPARPRSEEFSSMQSRRPNCSR